MSASFTLDFPHDAWPNRAISRTSRPQTTPIAALTALMILAGWGASPAPAQDVYAGRLAVINKEMNFTPPAAILHAPGYPASFKFKVNYKVEDNAVAWSYDTSVTVNVERETGDHGSESWESVWTKTESESRTWPNEKYKREGSIFSETVQQTEPVTRYRIWLTGKSNRTTKSYNWIVTVAASPSRGGETLGRTLAVSRAAEVVYQDFKDAIEPFEDSSPDYSGIRDAVSNLYWNTLSFWPHADLVLANTPAEFASAVAEEVAELLGLQAAVLLVDYVSKAHQLIEQVTADVREAITQSNYAKAMQPAARELGDNNGQVLALAAGDRISRALENYGYHGSIDADQLRRELAAADSSLATFVEDLGRAKADFDSGARQWTFNIGGSNIDEVIARGKRFFDVPERAVAGHLFATRSLLQAMENAKRLARPPKRKKQPVLQLVVQALNDRPRPVRVGLHCVNDDGRVVAESTLSWDAGDNAYSAKKARIPGDARFLRLTFLNDAYRPGGPDLDRNAFIDFLEIEGKRLEAEDFHRTGGRGGQHSGCGKRREPQASGGFVADCGNGGDYIEFDLAK